MDNLKYRKLFLDIPLVDSNKHGICGGNLSHRRYARYIGVDPVGAREIPDGKFSGTHGIFCSTPCRPRYMWPKTPVRAELSH